MPELQRPPTQTSKDQRDALVKASERNPALKREEHLEKVLEKVTLQDTTEAYKSHISVLYGLRQCGFDTTPLIHVLENYGRLSVDRGGAGRLLIRDLLSPPKIYTGLGPISPEEEQPGLLARIWGMMPWARRD
jgi:hypothetical protein